MSSDRLMLLISAALKAELLEAYKLPAQLLHTGLVNIICSRQSGPIQINLPVQNCLDDEISMAARNGTEDGIPPELEAELRVIEESDLGTDSTPEDLDDAN